MKSKKLVCLVLTFMLCLSFTVPSYAGSTDSRKLVSTYICISKSKTIDMRDDFKYSSFNGWTELGITTAIGFIPVFGTTAAIFTGILFVMPTAKENIAGDLGDIVDEMDSGEYVIIEFQMIIYSIHD